MNFNIALYKPDLPKFHILESYKEVMLSVQWALNELGHNCTITTNEIKTECRNIVFGWQIAFQLAEMLGKDPLEEFPADTILYNLEQYPNMNLTQHPRIVKAASHFQIWDYSPDNIKTWENLNPKHRPFYAKIGFAPCLQILTKDKEDIDLGFFGSLSDYRYSQLLHAGMNSNLSAYTLCTYYGLWGSLRDEFLSRTKLLINLSSGGSATAIFEIVRVSYYLANKKAVLCQATDELLVEPDVKAVLKFCKSDELGIFAEYLLSNEKIREDYAQECYEMFVSRDLRSILEGFFNR